jgi:hypothetical protein
LYQGKNDPKTNVIARRNYARLKDHLHIMTGIAEDIAMGYFILSKFDPENFETIIDTLMYHFNIMRQYGITEDKSNEVERVYANILIQFQRNIMSLDPAVTDMDQFRAINQLYLIIAQNGYTKLAVTLSKDRTTSLLTHVRAETIQSWLTTLATIYQFAGLAANGTFALYLKQEVYPHLSSNKIVLSSLQATTAIHPKNNIQRPPFTLLESPYQTDVPKVQRV